MLQPPLPLHDYKRVSKRPTYSPEHNTTWKYTHTNTSPPISTLPAARKSYKPHSLLDWKRKNDGSQKRPKKMWKCVAAFGQAGVDKRGGVDPLASSHNAS